MAATAKDFVEQQLKANKVVVFSKSYCPFCTKAKNALNKFTSDYKVIELEDRDDMDAIQDYLREITGARSVPRVFINGKCIGGGDETTRAANDGSLQKMLAQ